VSSAKNVHGQYCVRAAVAASIAAALFASQIEAVKAAEAEEEAVELEEVQITGSRIRRPEYEASSPLISIAADKLETRAGLNVESYLNQLPNFNPAATPVTTNMDVQISPINSVGISSISLRGFGPNRNLVLVDGRRMVPANSLMVTDVSAIPSALIQSVETISGGASAVYGADAIGGVTNFILKKDFQGFEFDVQGNITEAGDGEETRAYGLLGTNFAEGRGNVTLGLETYDRKAAYERNRSFYTNSWADPTVGGDFFVFGYNGFNSAFTFNAPNTATLNAIFADRPTYTSGPAAGQQTGVRAFTDPFGFGIFEGFRFNNDGSVFATGSGNNLWKYLQGGGVIDNYEYATQLAYDGTIGVGPDQTYGQVMDTLKWNNTEAYASSPQKRYSIFASGNYNITDSMQFFARGTWSESRTSTRLFPANASYGWEALIPYDPLTDSPIDPTINAADPAEVAAALAGLRPNAGFIASGTAGAKHPVSPEMALLLNSRANPAAGWILETYPLNSFDARSTVNTNSMWQLDAGLSFKLPFGDWSGDISATHGEYSSYNNAFGNNSLTRWRLLVTQPDYGRNAVLESNQPGTSPTVPQSPGFGGAIVNCTSGFYDMIFAGDTRPTEDCLTGVQAQLQTRAANQQNVYEANLQGGLFALPAGQVRAALGFQFRENRAQFVPDILQSTSSFADQVVGVYPTGYMDARMLTRDTYAELLVPVLRDVPGVKSLELELGGRYSNYSATESTYTYKVGANLQFNNALRLRGGYNRATRAPNLGELFLNTQEIFTVGGNFGDPCGLRSNAPYSAAGAIDPNTGTPYLDPTVSGNETAVPELAPGQTQAGANSAHLICQAMMGAGTTSFYAQDQTAPGAGGGFAWVLQEGNRNLKSEKADTWTAGLVFSSRSANPWLSGFSGAIDWWKVDISDAIQQYSTDYASWRCYGAVLVTTPEQAAAQAATDACKNVGRSQGNGAALTTTLAYDNQATIETSGVDLQLNWAASLSNLGFESAPGRVGFNMLASWTDYYRTKQSPLAFDVETDWVGTLGPNLTGTNPGAYEYRLNSSLFYSVNNLSFSLRWRFLPPVWAAEKASEEAIRRNNEAVAAGAEGIILGYTPGTGLKTGSYSAFDLSMNWNVSPTLSIRAGIDNLFDISPKVVGGSTGARNGYPYDPSLTRDENLAALAAVCDGQAPGCIAPTSFSLGSTGAGTTSAGFYDTLGRRYFLGVKLSL